MLAWEDAYMRLDIDRERRIVRQTRTARSYDDLTALQKSLSNVIEHMKDVARADYALLQDMRAPRGRNDPEFESVIMRERPRLSGGFRKLAVLMATQVGRLQAQRFLQNAPHPARAFLDETEALQWLSQP